MTSTSTPLPPNNGEETNHLTPRKNNSFKRRETHPKVDSRHYVCESELQQHEDDGMDQVYNPLHQDLNQQGTDTNSYNMQQNLAFESSAPLSWHEARRRLKCTLELWIKDEKNRISPSAIPNYRFLSLKNLDIILAILLCVAFVILSFTLPTQSDLPESFILMQRIAAVLFLVSSLASASILNRWARVRERDQSIERRRCVTSFLKEMECIQDETVSVEGSGGENRATDDVSISTDVIPRKNVEDVYSTYRLNNTKRSHGGNPSHPGAWHRIPTLLLVKGDHIALKVGDMCPAKCKSIKDEGSSMTVNAGERLTLDLLGDHHAKVPAGKSTVKADDDILMLANRVQIFEMLETPLESFLNKEDASVSSKLPQLIRQGQSVRAALLPAAFITFFFTSVILLARTYVMHQNFFASSVWTIPILAALCFLPITTPMFLFLLECIGTARILVTVHPWASNQKQSIEHNVYREICVDGEMAKTPSWLVCRYIAATLQSRLQSSAHSVSKSLLTIPPASMHLLEKLGLVTAITLVDDELACEPYSTPQQLLIPSKDGGLKILDLCPAFSEEDEYSTDSDEIEQTNNHSSRSSTQFRRSLDVMANNLDSDDEDVYETRFAHSFSAPARSLRKRLKKRYNRKRSSPRVFSFGANKKNSQAYPLLDDADVQFEDPNWWQFLPSLKCIGLSCMLIESKEEGNYHLASKVLAHENPNPKVAFNILTSATPQISAEKKLLVNHLCLDRERSQLRVLARCIGFSTSPSDLGQKGDTSPFTVRRHLHIISSDLLRNRMKLKYHAMGLEESRNWSRLYTDADTIFVKDSRSGGDLVLTVGDARVVTSLSPDWWQGENSTISPLTASDRQIIIETQNNWMLSDLDVQAFSYAPLPYSADQKIGFGHDGDHVYLLDNSSNEQGAATGGFWSLVKNQIFLGLLGSSVRPRKEIEPLILASNDAGVRFVYFSPRNMRRTKEIASQMGIDVAWNCAISLRPLDEGEDDLYRMTSNYADWDVNARLPHGVEDVKRHLEEVDNVPLLVSIYTDVTKKTTADMVNVFQDYHDTVLSVGLSHLPCNHEIFARADIAIGVDVFSEECLRGKSVTNANALFPAEISFIASISSHSSVFNLWGSRSTCRLVEIIRVGRASLEAASSSAMFFLSGLLSFGIFLMLCPCTASTVVATIPALEAFLYVQIILHGIGLSMAFTDGNKEQMTRVPQKNDSFKASMKWYWSLFLRTVSSSICSHLIYLVALGELVWALDPTFVEEHCLLNGYNRERTPLAAIIRCQELEQYSGMSIIAAGSISLASLALCNAVLSASFVFRTESIWSEPPWKQNHQWVGSVAMSVILVSVYLLGTLERGTMLMLPWYFYVMFALSPFLCLGISEMVKHADAKQDKRAVMMRRLQFETRLGMWSPKESTHIVEHANTRVDTS